MLLPLLSFALLAGRWLVDTRFAGVWRVFLIFSDFIPSASNDSQVEPRELEILLIYKAKRRFPHYGSPRFSENSFAPTNRVSRFRGFFILKFFRVVLLAGLGSRGESRKKGM